MKNRGGSAKHPMPSASFGDTNEDVGEKENIGLLLLFLFLFACLCNVFFFFSVHWHQGFLPGQRSALACHSAQNALAVHRQRRLLVRIWLVAEMTRAADVKSSVCAMIQSVCTEIQHTALAFTIITTTPSNATRRDATRRDQNLPLERSLTSAREWLDSTRQN